MIFAQLNWGNVQELDSKLADRRAIESYAHVLEPGVHPLHERLPEHKIVTVAKSASLLGVVA